MTRENAHLFLPFVQALVDGKTLQIAHYHTGEWRDWGWGDGKDFFGEDANPALYRIKPEPKLVPLGPEDVPPGSVVRYPKNGAPWVAVDYPGGDFIAIATKINIQFTDALRDGWEIKRPGEEWQPCSKPEQEGAV